MCMQVWQRAEWIFTVDAGFIWGPPLKEQPWKTLLFFLMLTEWFRCSMHATEPPTKMDTRAQSGLSRREVSSLADTSLTPCCQVSPAWAAVTNDCVSMRPQRIQGQGRSGSRVGAGADPGSGQEWLQGQGRRGSRVRAGVDPGSGQERIQGQDRNWPRIGPGVFIRQK